MLTIYFIYGLAFFCLGLAAALEARRTSDLPLSRQLPWLAAFGLSHAVVEWADMFLLATPDGPYQAFLLGLRTLLLPISAIFLIRFGAGLIGEVGPLPKGLWFLPLILIAPAALLTALALVSATQDPVIAIDVWSRYLLYFPGCLLAGIGFLRQRNSLTRAGIDNAGNLMLGAALIFFFNALVAGLIVPESPYGIAPWLNYRSVMAATGVPVQFWRMLSAVTLTILVVRAMDVFETNRKQQLAASEEQRMATREILRESEERFRTVFEMAPFGMDIVAPDGRPIQSNHTLQQMLGYTADELRSMVYLEYTHPDDVEKSAQLVREIAEGKRKSAQLEKRYYNKDGSLVWAHVAVSGVRDPDGQIRYFVAMVEDITERKRIEEALRVEREQVQMAKLLATSTARKTAETWFDALVEISRRISRMENIDEVLLHIIRQTQDLLKCDTVSFGLLDDSGRLQLEYHAIGDRAQVINPPLAFENEPLLQVLNSARSRRYPQDVEGPDAVWNCPTVAESIQNAAAVPLRFDGRLVGGMWVGRFGAQSFTLTDLAGLESIADQAVIALQHSLMAARLQSLAVLEERSRIAREMHDGLAQVLGYLSLEVQTLDALVRGGEYEKALAELQQTRENIKIAQADVRENILSLRTTLADGTGIVSALEEYVTEFGLQTGSRTELVTEIDSDLKLSPLAEVQMVRIVQEALANVRKHARADHVQVLLSEYNDCLEITITDDGIGFLPSDNSRHFGLQTMAERAEIAGGSLTIRSMPGEGTKVDLRLPLL